MIILQLFLAICGDFDSHNFKESYLTQIAVVGKLYVLSALIGQSGEASRWRVCY